MAKRTLPDLFSNCYEGDHRKLSPEQFQAEWCGKCLNAGCRNSRGSELKWVQRMLGQEDLLLDNPKYGDPKDPRLQQYAEQDFKDMLHQALTIEVSSRKGDWSVPTEAEVGAAAAELVGLVPPSGFKEPEPGLEPGEGYAAIEEAKALLQEAREAREMPPEAEPPQRLVDEVQNYEFKGEPETLEELAEEIGEEPPGPLAVPAIERWRVRGDSGTIYEVTRDPDGSWECSCPSRENPCKHARDIAQKLSRAAPEAEAGHPTRPPPDPNAPRPRQLNTSASTGVMIGGGTPPTPEPEPDPWAAPEVKPKERVIPVGGKVTFGSGKKG
jgi:hypothetical protein